MIFNKVPSGPGEASLGAPHSPNLQEVQQFLTKQAFLCGLEEDGARGLQCRGAHERTGAVKGVRCFYS